MIEAQSGNTNKQTYLVKTRKEERNLFWAVSGGTCRQYHNRVSQLESAASNWCYMKYERIWCLIRSSSYKNGANGRMHKREGKRQCIVNKTVPVGQSGSALRWVPMQPGIGMNDSRVLRRQNSPRNLRGILHQTVRRKHLYQCAITTPDR